MPKEKSLEEKWNQLKRQYESLEAPPLPDPNKKPIGADVERNVVEVSYMNERGWDVIEMIPAEGAWKPVFDFLVKRFALLEQMESVAKQIAQAQGYTVEFVPKEYAEIEEE